MKCYRIFISILLFFQVASAEAQLTSFDPASVKVYDSVIPKGNDKVIKNNEVYDVVIRSQKTNDELKDFKSKKINKIMFVMEFYEKANQRFFRIFVTDPPEPKKDDSDKEKDDPIIFDRLAFDYQAVNPKSSQDFVSYDIPYKFMEHKNTIVEILTYIFVMMLIFPVVWMSYQAFLKWIFKNKQKKIRKKKQKELKLFINSIQERDDFEKLYTLSQDVHEYLEIDEEEFKTLLKLIYQFQYMRSWSNEQMILLQRHLSNIVKVNSGI